MDSRLGPSRLLRNESLQLPVLAWLPCDWLASALRFQHLPGWLAARRS
jgi:hypothetical protein